MTITLMLIAMIGLSLLNVPIAIALGFVAMAAIAIIQGPDMLPNLALEMSTARRASRCSRSRCSSCPARS